jgi:hypothetical protein
MIELTESLEADKDESIIAVRCDCGWVYRITVTGFQRMQDPDTFMTQIEWLKELGVAHDAGHTAEREKNETT